MHYRNHPTQHLRRAWGNGRDLFIVEIGSNDGKSGDPLYPLIRRNRSVPIEALPLAAVLERQKVERLDVLLIDTEGYDWQVLRQLDFGKYQPRVIFIEHKHLSPEDRAAMREFLRDYDILDLGYDFLCTRRTG